MLRGVPLERLVGQRKDDMNGEIIKLVISHEKLPHEDGLVNDIKELVYSYAGKMSTAAAFGCIEIAKTELLKEIYEQ